MLSTPSTFNAPRTRREGQTYCDIIVTFCRVRDYTCLQSLHFVPVKLVLGDAPAKPQPHPGHTLRPRRLVERCVGLPPRLPTALRRRLPGGQLAGSQALKGEEEKA